jgi:PPOX class probable F420-dependent enzyme
MAYRRMTDDEVWAFLAGDPPHTAKCATVRADGSPHVAPVWVAFDDRTLVFTTNSTTVKGRSILRDPRVALCFDDERPPFSFVLVEGHVEVIDDVDEVRRWAAIIGGRYMGADRAAEYGARNGVPGELLLRLRPDKITSAKNLAD